MLEKISELAVGGITDYFEQDIVDNGLIKTASEESLMYFRELKTRPSHVYILAIAMSAGEYYGSNSNGDYFLEEDLERYHKVFEIAKVFWNHDHKDATKASGEVLKSFWNSRMKRIELVLDMPVSKSRNIPDLIKRKIPIKVSMGLSTPSEKCSVCGNITRQTYASRCEHLKFMMHREVNGKRVYAICGTPYKIFDISIIERIQADKTAYSLEAKMG